MALLWMTWPYLSLWRLDRLAAADQPEALAAVVDMDSVREQLRRRLNKDTDSLIGEVSDPFIDWISDALRGPRTGVDDLDRRVSLSWLHRLLRERSGARGGLGSRVGWAFFISPTDFLVRIDAPPRAPLFLHLRPAFTGWKVVAVYY